MRQPRRACDVSHDTKIVRHGGIEPPGGVESIGHQRVLDADLDDLLEIRDHAFGLLENTGGI